MRTVWRCTIGTYTSTLNPPPNHPSNTHAYALVRCTYTYKHSNIHADIQTYIRARTHKNRTFRHPQLRTHVQKHNICSSKLAQTQTHTHIHAHIHTYTLVHNTCTHEHTHTHTYTQAHTQVHTQTNATCQQQLSATYNELVHLRHHLGGREGCGVLVGARGANVGQQVHQVHGVMVQFHARGIHAIISVAELPVVVAVAVTVEVPVAVEVPVTVVFGCNWWVPGATWLN